MTRITLKVLAASLTIFSASLFVLSAYSAEPEAPDVNTVFDSEKEMKIKEVAGLPPDKAFQRLKEMDFLINDALLSEAAFKAFEKRKAEGIGIALGSLTLPVFEVMNGKVIIRTDDFLVAKRILEAFPDDAASGLRELYKKGNENTRGNVIRASGRVAGGRAIVDLLINALDDKNFCEEELDEVVGLPLRICDVAYNQLVLRYKIKGVLRTIGTPHKLETRDYHIAILRDLLQRMIL